MMVEGVTTYAQTLSTSPADSNKATIEAPAENKEQKKEKLMSSSVLISVQHKYQKEDVPM